MAYMHSNLAEEVARKMRLGTCQMERDARNLQISSAMMLLISQWRLEPALSTPAVYTVTGVQGIIGTDSYLMVAVGQSDISQFRIGDTVELTYNGITYEDSIVDINYQAAAWYFLFDIPIVGGFTYTMTKQVSYGDTANNYLSVDEMIAVSKVMNEIHGTNYCVDFVLT